MEGNDDNAVMPKEPGVIGTPSSGVTKRRTAQVPELATFINCTGVLEL